MASEINFSKNHQLGRAEARRRIVAIEPKLKEKYGVTLSWKGDEAIINGSGVTGTVEVRDDVLSVGIKLGLLLRPLAGKIRESLERQIDGAIKAGPAETSRPA